MITDPLFYLAAIPAVVIVGLAKGGFVGLGILGLPLMALTVSPVQAAAIMLPILIVQDAVGLYAFRKHLNKRLLAITLTGALVGVILATFTAAAVSEAAVRLAVGLIAVVFALNWWLNLAKQAAGERPGGVAWGLLWGGISGFTSFISHAGGPPFQVYVLPLQLPRDVLVGTTVWFFAAVNIMKVAPYVWLGQFTNENLMTSLALMPVAIASTMAGVWLVRRVDSAAFYRLVYGLLVLVGFKLAYDGLVALI
ncbi:sulfite exporter TauE/SafE family protein [Chelatococcus composti]|jgi:Predicted permeases|uniref:Probable membrane transporter protein n=1 Tax=Chelatococcus composti TaxID=1743235 RepID=A0A841K726_9HYPH|nr:sulfite exporter TauE/SafE family protein [Chelatococcus composti]MBB6167880.1 hypothetical protein [Chelatococcus composti]MBS7734925.1 sulfite exporter TauE/SafE family protein [Chelatococcus composti]PZN45953.1 MAG: hypothetical protein DIU59_01190 [Pseudomonadota bacterium]GGG35258.1 UPF0721 transmembrane protein [Chelatococcus composti]